MNPIRKAKIEDAARLAEIEIFNYRMNFYPIFQDDQYYFDELQVPGMMQKYREEPRLIGNTYVFDDGVVKGFIRIDGSEVAKLFVEPVLHGHSIGAQLLDFAMDALDVRFLWALEKNVRAISFYQRHGFCVTGEKKPEDGTTEFLVRMERR